METVRLTPHSRLRRLVKTSRLRLTGVLQTLETKGTVRDILLLGVPAHTCAVGLYFMGCVKFFSAFTIYKLYFIVFLHLFYYIYKQIYNK